MQDPGAGGRVHAAYLRAGVEASATSTSARCRHVLAGAGLDDEPVAINTRAVELARAAIENVAPDRPVAVAGSMSNNLAWIPGSFSPDERYAPTAEQEAANYREMAETLAAAGVDLILMEMMSDIEHASRATQAAVDTGLPVWVGVSCSLRDDGSLTAWDIHTEEPAERLSDAHLVREPMPLESVIDAMTSFGPQVVGLMHSRVESIGPGLGVVRQRWHGPVRAYPETSGSDKLEPETFAAHCERGVEGGVRECRERWDECGSGMPEKGLEGVCAEVAGLDLGDFFDATVRGTGELPLETLLREHGVAYCLRRSNGRKDKGGKHIDAAKLPVVWMGATVQNRSGKPVFSSVAHGCPAELDGVSPGD